MVKKYLILSLLFLLIILVSAYFLFNPEKNEINQSARTAFGGTYIKLSHGFTHYKLQTPPDSVNARLVVLVHGGTIPSWTWDKQTTALLNAGFKVLSYDKYGRGYSDRPDITYDQALYKKQLVELIEKLDIKKPFDLIGLSVGGGTAVNFASQYPDKIDKLILIAPLINNFKTPAIFKTPVLGEFIARIAGIRVIVKRFKSLFNDLPDAEKYTKLFIEQTTYKGFERSVLSMLRNDAVGDYTSAYKKIGKLNLDTLLIWGKNDTEITKPMIDKIRSLVPNIEYKPVADTGHGVVFQKKEIVNKLILDFL